MIQFSLSIMKSKSIVFSSYFVQLSDWCAQIEGSVRMREKLNCVSGSNPGTKEISFSNSIKVLCLNDVHCFHLIYLFRYG